MADQIIFHVDSYPLKHYEIDNCGYLRFVAPIARTGKLTYLDADGNPYDETVPAQTLIDSLDSFKTKAIAYPHPPYKLDAKNTRQYARGLSGYTGFFDGSFLWLTGTVTDHETIQAIVNKTASEISPGYDALVRKSDSELIQARRVGNHLAVVPRGRNGRKVSFKIDSEDQPVIQVYTLDNDVELADLPDTPEILLEAFKPSRQYFTPDSTSKAVTGDSRQDTDDKQTNTLGANKTMPVQILIDETIYNIDGDDAVALRDAVGKLKGSAKTVQEKLDTALTETQQLKTDKADLESQIGTIKGEKEALKTKLDEASQTKTDSADQFDFGKEITTRLALWNEITPSIQKFDAAFKMDADSDAWKLTPTEIKRFYLIKRDQASGNTERATELTNLDMSLESNQRYVEGLYSGLKPSENRSEPSHTDSVLNALLSGSRTKTTTNLDAEDDPRDAMTRGIESNGKVKAS